MLLHSAGLYDDRCMMKIFLANAAVEKEIVRTDIWND